MSRIQQIQTVVFLVLANYWTGIDAKQGPATTMWDVQFDRFLRRPEY